MRYDYRFSPTAASVSEALGVPAPAAWVRVVQWVHAQCEKQPEAFGNWLLPALGFRLGGADLRTPATPAEFFPIGEMPTGTVLGYVVHAPELGADDYPVATFDERTGDAVALVGRTTREALETLAAAQLAADEIRGSALARHEQHLALARLLALPEITPDKARRRWDTEGGPLPVVPEVPPGYVYWPGTDGVGTLVPRAAVRNGARPTYKVSRPLEFFLEAGLTALEQRLPGLALFYVREGLTLHAGSDDCYLLLGGPLADAYDQLGRAGLAHIARRYVLPDPRHLALGTDSRE